MYSSSQRTQTFSPPSPTISPPGPSIASQRRSRGQPRRPDTRSSSTIGAHSLPSDMRQDHDLKTSSLTSAARPQQQGSPSPGPSDSASRHLDLSQPRRTSSGHCLYRPVYHSLSPHIPLAAAHQNPHLRGRFSIRLWPTHPSKMTSRDIDEVDKRWGDQSSALLEMVMPCRTTLSSTTSMSSRLSLRSLITH
ncbi:hypothetical protein C8F01DRAFT_1192687 [Mycena amicta]|nr:hypothetical protein C8F01DRAFT_1192687 [Mycena amicta]